MRLKENTIKEMAYFLTWTLGAVLLAHTLDSCETGWTLYGRFNVCYKLFIAPKLDWSDARNFCKRQNAKLADLYDYEEQLFIKYTLMQKMRGHGVWIGAADLQEYMDWRWVDNSQMDISKFEWWEGNPDNGGAKNEFFDFFVHGEDCVEISLRDRHRGQLNDYDCRVKLPFLCKKTDITTTTPPLKTTRILTSYPSSDADDKPIVPLVVAVVSLSLLAMVAIGVAVLLWRKRKQELQRNIYEDVSPTPNENTYTSLQASDQLQNERNGACPTVNYISTDDDSYHEYHSVYFPSFQSRSVSAKSKNSAKGESKTVRYIKQHTGKKY